MLFALIEWRLWWAALGTFIVAALTDWLDGWWARRFNQLSAFGRTFDPLTDKVMLGGAFIFLLAVEESGFVPWMVAVVIGRELLITGIRGYVESLGKKFGADWFGKLKTVLQCVVLISALTYLALHATPAAFELLPTLVIIHTIILYAMLAATILSGLQYCWKAIVLLR